MRADWLSFRDDVDTVVIQLSVFLSLVSFFIFSLAQLFFEPAAVRQIHTRQHGDIESRTHIPIYGKNAGEKTQVKQGIL